MSTHNWCTPRFDLSLGYDFIHDNADLDIPKV
jgi:hypothetical protein